VNRQIALLFRVCAAGFAVLVTMTAYWQIWAAPSLAERRDNARLVVRQLEIRRGLITAADGTVLARDVRRRTNGQTLFLRHYPFGALYAHVLGYNTVAQGRTGLELSENDYLTASNADLSTIFGRIGDQLRGRAVTGADIQTTLAPAAQRAAYDALAGQRGAVVAIEPRSGRILAMVSRPSFDPNTIGARFRHVAREPGSPLLNRVLGGLYAPGSTFKTVTAAAALERNLFTPESLIDAHGQCISAQGSPLCNFGGESFGTISLTDALTHSVNTVFAQVGERVGAANLRATMRRLGFDQKPPLDYPSDEMAASGLYAHGRLLPENAPIDVARVAIGQERLEVTPFQMATVAATVADGGLRMRPLLVERAVSPGGGTLFRSHPEQLGRAFSARTAQELGTMMQNVVREGTGTAAALAGIDVAGKTGTAETGVAGLNTAWFIAFAPAEKPRIAIAVVVEHTPLQGGLVAAPIARDVIEAYLNASVAK
jgi:peptidoglycan glycosyltransferase